MGNNLNSAPASSYYTVHPTLIADFSSLEALAPPGLLEQFPRTSGRTPTLAPLTLTNSSLPDGHPASGLYSPNGQGKAKWGLWPGCWWAGWVDLCIDCDWLLMGGVVIVVVVDGGVLSLG